ncbi:MAG: ATP-dependent sacrificial sulfur transferase LarE [Nitrospira sp.]|nr:ATP-dependent sacrificial sulfur transferase LarE [Nitrospira sp.]MCP9441577.1 ATP-dependent sacrificial sulfur transferase LarE [Nitrospira sp.]
MHDADLQRKLSRLRTLLSDMGSVLVAYSGGIDSTFLLKVAHEQLGDRAVGVTAVSPTFPAIELEQAQRVAEEIGARHTLVHTDQLQMPEFVRNDATRCFHCKSDLYRLLGTLRQTGSHIQIVDGTNLDDLSDDRPGIKAAYEWGVRSPLVDAGLSKADIRILAKELGLSNWNKPAAACLSSRIPRGTPITLETLSRIERAEALLHQEGFRHVRVRDHDKVARIEVDPEEIAAFLDPERRKRVTSALKTLGFGFVTLDLEGYRAGGVSLR